MEVAGTIVGTVSLGITVCDGIIQYCHSWKTQDDDIRALKALTGGLKQLLAELDTKLQSNPAFDPSVLQILKTSSQNCAGHIDSVLHLSGKYTPGQLSGLKGKAADLAQKLTFPFKKKTLDDLRDTVVAFRGNIETALQIITMHV